mmetsp:Transcript_30184/g.59969  ORF Transcript_30184/g.59969 Transcript_30184/m.59969 type:complete len:219 (-) Transcript_30184:141-797(-)
MPLGSMPAMNVTASSCSGVSRTSSPAYVTPTPCGSYGSGNATPPCSIVRHCCPGGRTGASHQRKAFMALAKRAVLSRALATFGPGGARALAGPRGFFATPPDAGDSFRFFSFSCFCLFFSFFAFFSSFANFFIALSFSLYARSSAVRPSSGGGGGADFTFLGMLPLLAFVGEALVSFLTLGGDGGTICFVSRLASGISSSESSIIKRVNYKKRISELY